ncbi:hypothetical protein AB8B21_05915 [Tardiphaga sp. 866_E4_N2_1]|uniref:hypothetical protein n=1 Tax=unclassified Tardiphaga TaxID=2631404 RepID=UPI003F2300BC
MDKIIDLFEKSLAEHEASIGKKDNLVGCGEIVVKEFRRQREQIITLGRLLADFYAGQQPSVEGPPGSPVNVIPLRVPRS